MRYRLLAGIVLILTGLSWPHPVTAPQAAEELPLNLRRLSDRVLIAWVGNHMQTIDVVGLRTARGMVKLIEKFRTMAREWREGLTQVEPDSDDYHFLREGVTPTGGDDRRRKTEVHDRNGLPVLQGQKAHRREDEHPRKQHRGDLGEGGR